MNAAQVWKGTVGRFPSALTDLARGLMRETPRCPATGRDYRYRVAASCERMLVACTEHRLRLDSTRGDLTPRPPIGIPDDATRLLFRRIRDAASLLANHASPVFISS